MTHSDRPLETALTLFLDHVDPALVAAHWETYPERIPEQIPLSLTLLYPWIPSASITEGDLDRVRSFFAGRSPLEFDLTRVDEFPGIVVYAVPEPDDELRTTMRALWALYPECPPYGRPGFEPPPHATLGRLEGDYATTLDAVKARVDHLLPVRCVVDRVTLMEEREPDRWRVRETFPLGGT